MLLQRFGLGFLGAINVKEPTNQKFKLIVEAPKHVIYSNTYPHTKTLWARNVNAIQAFFIPCTDIHILMRPMTEIRTHNLLSRCHFDLIMSKNQLN